MAEQEGVMEAAMEVETFGSRWWILAVVATGAAMEAAARVVETAVVMAVVMAAVREVEDSAAVRVAVRVAVVRAAEETGRQRRWIPQQEGRKT